MHIDISCKPSFHLLMCFFPNYYKFLSMSPNTDFHFKHRIVAFYSSEIVAEQRTDRKLMVSIGAVLCVLVIVIYMPFLYKYENFLNLLPLKCWLFQITNLMHNSFILQQYVCYTTILNMFRAARCSKHVEDRSVTHILLKNKGIVH